MFAEDRFDKSSKGISPLQVDRHIPSIIEKYRLPNQRNTVSDYEKYTLQNHFVKIAKASHLSR